MKKFYFTIAIIFTFLLSVQLSNAKSVQQTVELAPGKIHESCLKLRASETINYSFSSNQNLDFNIHYHLKNKVEYPLKLQAKTHQADSFTALLAQGYCLMWTNRGSQLVQLKFKYDKVK